MEKQKKVENPVRARHIFEIQKRIDWENPTDNKYIKCPEKDVSFVWEWEAQEKKNAKDACA